MFGRGISTLKQKFSVGADQEEFGVSVKKFWEKEAFPSRLDQSIIFSPRNTRPNLHGASKLMILKIFLRVSRRCDRMRRINLI